MNLFSDLSGSISKNRFRIEMLWGISKMFEVFDQYEDFTVVFDNVCDIELHIENGQEFYQIKSNKVASPKSISYYLKQPTNSNSIFGKLVVLNEKRYNTLKIALVSNAYLSHDKKIFSEFEDIRIDYLDEKYKEIIKNKLADEFGRQMNIENFYYIHTSMNLKSPDNDLLGKIVFSFQKIKNCEPKKPNALYRLIVETAQRKAQYEFKSEDYEELISNKGFSKTELIGILNEYADSIDESIEQVQDIIEKTKSIALKKELKLALTNLIRNIDTSVELKRIESKIISYLSNNKDYPDIFDELVQFLTNNYSCMFPVEINDFDIKVFIMIVVKRWENNYYE